MTGKLAFPACRVCGQHYDRGDYRDHARSLRHQRALDAHAQERRRRRAAGPPPADRYGGERQRTRSRATGAVYVLCDAHGPAAVFDPDGGRWVTVCDTHGTLCNHETLALARSHLPYGEWCEACMGTDDDQE